MIDDKKVTIEDGKTILQIATENGITIPTLCHVRELTPYGACRICSVQVKGEPDLMMACNTIATDGMEIATMSDAIYKARVVILNTLLSEHNADCLAPCRLACPANVDVQAYIAAAANGHFHEAIKIIKEQVPLPLSIGRVCHAFCEKKCRRRYVDEPLQIRAIKRYCADMDLWDYWQWVPEPVIDKKDQKVCIIGAGPSGLTCGYYLSYSGYQVDIYEAMPQAGGWLRYGIPEYRLPKDILDHEIDLLCGAGMNIFTEKRLGVDIYINDIKNDYDAVYIAIGATKALGMDIPGVDKKNVFLGVDFLKLIILDEKLDLGKKVAVVGGGNTAVACARTAQRLGCEVSIIYRRTSEDMSADTHDIKAAVMEGIQLRTLANPVEYIGDDTISQIKIEIMQPGEMDESGRRKPVGTGEYEILDFTAVIIAFSQTTDTDCLENLLPLTKDNTVMTDDHMYTGVKNIFAGGDIKRGPRTAIEAVADGKRAAENINGYLNAEFGIRNSESPTASKRDNNFLFSIFNSKFPSPPPSAQIPDPACYGHLQKIHHNLPREIGISERLYHNEVELCFSTEQNNHETNRCLECGCFKYNECKLRQYATEYGVYSKINQKSYQIDDSHKYISKDYNKCIICGLCLRLCSEIAKKHVFTLAFRGDKTTITTGFNKGLKDTECDTCGICVASCPTAALSFKNIQKDTKASPRKGDIIYQNCAMCNHGCRVQVHSSHGQIRSITAPTHDTKQGSNGRFLCFEGYFGWQIFENPKRITHPMQRIDKQWQPITNTEVKDILKIKNSEFISKSEKKIVFIGASATLEERLIFLEISQNHGFELHITKPPEWTDSELPTPIKESKNIQEKHHNNSLIFLYKIQTVNIKGKNNYIIVFDTDFQHEIHKSADLYIPTSSYLEMDATFKNYQGEICKTTNAKKSNLFYMFLNILGGAGLISPMQVEPGLWEWKVENGGIND